MDPAMGDPPLTKKSDSPLEITSAGPVTTQTVLNRAVQREAIFRAVYLSERASTPLAPRPKPVSQAISELFPLMTEKAPVEASERMALFL
jgi:hypothetical protein